MHYLRVYIDPGMVRAGCPLTDDERARLDFIDDLLRREDLLFQYRLRPGEALFNNNRWLLHGRTAFVDVAAPEDRRCWRGPGCGGAIGRRGTTRWLSTRRSSAPLEPGAGVRALPDQTRQRTKRVRRP